MSKENMSKAMLFSRNLLLFLLFLSLLFNRVNTASATINGYLGTGYFPTNSLNRCHVGTAWSTESSSAAGRWSLDTDLTMYYSCTNPHITTSPYAYGNTGWAGAAYICNTNNECNTTAAFNGTYKSCTAKINLTAINGNPTYYTSAEVKKLVTHELGHCYSLDHANVSGNVMKDAANPGTQDINLVNARY